MGRAGAAGAAPAPDPAALGLRFWPSRASTRHHAPTPAAYQTATFAVLEKKLVEILAEEEARHPARPVTVFCTDEHRIGLKPVLRRGWAPRGQRPIALGHHRYEWLYVTVFVAPATGESVWFVGHRVSKPLFEELLASFAHAVGAGRDRTVVLVLDNAGWHTEPGLAVPEGLRLVYLPPHSPELQPAECLWGSVDEPIVNKHFDTLADLEAVVSARCSAIANDPRLAKAATAFHWWPGVTKPK